MAFDIKLLITCEICSSSPKIVALVEPVNEMLWLGADTERLSTVSRMVLSISKGSRWSSIFPDCILEVSRRSEISTFRRSTYTDTLSRVVLNLSGEFPEPFSVKAVQDLL